MSKRIRIIFLIIILFLIAGISFWAQGYIEIYLEMMPLLFGFLVIISIPMIIPYFLGIFSAKKSILSKDDIIKNEQYYRDIIKNYSPACLSYIDDFQIQKEVIVATLLSLKLKHKIEIFDDKIIVVNPDIIGLSTTEINVLNSINNNIVEMYNFSYFKKMAQEEALNSQLIINKNPKIKGTIIIWIIVILIFLLGLFLDYLKAIEGDSSGGSMVLIFLQLNAVILTIYYAAQDNYSSFAKIRTEKGNEINKKLEGLKQYIKKYSALDEKKSEFINIWDEYLIYSVIFKQNRKIEKEIGHLIVIE